MYCVKCGREATELYEHLCPECYVKSRNFVEFPQDVVVHSCRSCGRFEMLGEWKNSGFNEAAESAIMNNTYIEKGAKLLSYELDIEQKSPIHYQANLRFYLQVAGLEVEREASIRVRHREITCPRCQKVNGNYYEAIIQVRPAVGGKFREEELEDISREIRRMVDAGFSRNPNIFITKEEDMHGGRDFYIGDSSYASHMARRLVKNYGAIYTESSSLWGMKNGRELYRMTYLVRLPPYRIGDFLEKDGKIYLLVSIGSDRIQCIDLESWGDFSFDGKERVSVLGGEEMIKKAVIVSESSNELQLMDPLDYRTLDVRKPAGFSFSEEVPVIRYQERLYLVPSLERSP